MLTSMNEIDLRGPSIWILTVLAQGRRHGYGVLEEARRLSGGAVELRIATLYTSLDRLAEAGLVAADGDEAVDGRLRRYFRITEAGAERLALEAAKLEATAAAARRALRSGRVATVVVA